MTNLATLARDMQTALQRERLEDFNRRKAWEYPPDAGDSTLGAWGIQNPMTLWLLRQAPELLEWTPKELVAGMLNPPKCPRNNCRAGMALKVAEAEGRLPRRWVWACHKPIMNYTGMRSRYGGFTDCGGRRPFAMYKPTAVAVDDDATPVGLRRLLQWTQEGATVEYQPDKYGQKRAVKVDNRKESDPPGRSRSAAAGDGPGASRRRKTRLA